jgi:pimeloyl-ACP methyl ester carboxylesterase
LQPAMDRSLRNPRGRRLAATWVDVPTDSEAIVVVGHGLTSDRTRPWSVALSDALADRGLPSVRLAFAGNGHSEGSFEDSCVSSQVDDLGAVLDRLAGRRVAYVGHSMGATVGVLRAATDTRIAALVSLAGLVHTAEFFRRLFGHLALGDRLLDKPGKPLGAALRDELLGLESVLPRASEVRVPWLLVHGTADDVVGVEHSRDVAALRGDAVELVELPGVDHSFTGASHARVATIASSWLERRLGET